MIKKLLNKDDKSNVGSLTIQTLPDKRLQPTPVIPQATYFPNITKEECAALRTGNCPVESGKSIKGDPCANIADALITGKASKDPIIIQYDFTTGFACCEKGGVAACVFAHIVEEFPKILLPTEIKNCRFYVGKHHIDPAAAAKFPSVFGLNNFSFPESVIEKTIPYANGKYVLHYDATWELLNPEDASSSEYAYMSKLRILDNYPAEAPYRLVIYFSDSEKQIGGAYDELKAIIAPPWTVGQTDRVTEEHMKGEPFKIVQKE